MEDYYCPVCGEELKKWYGDVLDCPNCGNMWDKEVLDEISGEQETIDD